MPPSNEQTTTKTTTDEMRDAPTRIKNPLVRALGIGGLIVVLLLGAWGIVTVALYLPSALGTIGSVITSPFSSSQEPRQNDAPAERLTATAPAGAVNAGAPFTLSWTHTGSGNFSYSISYSCTNDFALDAPLPNGSYQRVVCNTPFNYTDAKSSMMLIPHTSPGKTVQVPFTVSAINLATNMKTASSTVVIRIAAPAQPQNQSQNQGGSGSARATPVSPKITGPADLSVRILSINSYGAQFEIKNSGYSTAPAGWIFTAALPLSPAYTYVSAAQQSLTPGSGIIYNLGWGERQYLYGYYGGSYATGGILTIVADPYGIVSETNRYNNTATTNVY